jgi:predicted RNA-binding Zn ribbon-like protein
VSSCYTALVSTEHRYVAGSSWLNLLATLGHAYGEVSIERLTDVDALREWLDHERLTPVAPLTDDDVAQARAFRETLRPVVLAVLDGRTPEVAPLQAWLSADEPLTAVVRDGRPAAAPPSTLTAALARLARQTVEQLPDAPLRACDDDECRLAYLDPGGRRRWCAPETCGVKARVRAHRARARVSPLTPA